VPRWSAVPSLGLLIGTVLLGALALDPAPALANGADATGTPAVADTPAPGDSSPPDASATPTPTGSVPPPASPTPQQPTQSPTAVRSGSHGHRPGLRVTWSATNAVLGPGYWRDARASSFTITVRNTGAVAAAIRIDYTVPAGVTDAATGACERGHCSVPSIAPRTSVTLPVAVTVSADAWRLAPLTGRFTVTASAAGGQVAGGQVAGGQGTWGVVFPPGPPASGIDLHVDDVTLGDRPDVPGRLRIKLTNTGALPVAATLDVVVPHGVRAGPMPADCANRPQPDPSTARCVLGTLSPAEQKSIVVPLRVDPAMRAEASLTGLVRATLTAAGQEARTAQASYQVLIPASLSGVTARGTSPVVPSATPGHARRPTLDSHRVTVWPLIAGSTAALIVAIVGLALGLRRRSERADPAGAPAGAAALAPASARSDEWWYSEPRRDSGTGPAPVPRPSGPVRLERVELPGSAARAEPATDRPPKAAESPAKAAESPAKAAEGPAKAAESPAEVIAELSEVAADLAEVAAILAGPRANRID
jgi:hypothetical protein